MTTNRTDAIDRTSKSCIHLTLRYPRARAEAKAAIWRQFVQNTKWFPGNTLTVNHYQRLVALQLNGCDIKDVFKMMN
ncbi:ATPase- AAA-type- core [Apiospora arundinis]